MDQQPKPPVMDVAPPPLLIEIIDKRPAAPAAEGPKKSAGPAHPKQPDQPKSGVGLAIFATVVIVLALAGLATYAYLQSR